MKPLIVFEMANNHMGDVRHGVCVINAIAEATARFRDIFTLAFKLQYRDLDTYIHPHYRDRKDFKYVSRFMETRLSDDELRLLVQAMRANGFVTVCTPFDEPSVDRILAHDVEIIKIASCSLTDWPLLERIAQTTRPVIASSAAARLEDLDAVVGFFLHRERPLSLLHCIGEYPAQDEALSIAQIGLLRQRYQDLRIGFSTHERPDCTESIMLALAQGATVFEKHVGLATERYTLNAYSASPAQVALWLDAGRRALEMLGGATRYTPSEIELASLRSLRRGLFAARDIAAGTTLTANDVFFAFPPQPGQLTANDWSKYSKFTARLPIAAHSPLMSESTSCVQQREKVWAIVQAVRALLKSGNVVVPGQSELEISHHYGLERFDEYGMTMITVVNREYCKKILVLLPGQKHPEQYHLEKEETFIVLHGEMELRLDNRPQQTSRGDVVTVMRGVHHEFSTQTGVVLEEISSTHIKDDSFYVDPQISSNLSRKTFLTYWM